MYNKVILMGRITKDIELKATQTGTSVCSFSIAVDRRFTDKGGERVTDFFNCVAWRQQAEFIQKHFGKGNLILVEGELQTRNYKDKDGRTVYVTEIIVDRASFTGEKKDAGATNTQANAPAAPELPHEQNGEDYPF